MTKVQNSLSPTQLLKKDHKKVASLLKKLSSKSTSDREELFSELDNELDAHAQIEETIFYPALKEAKPTHDIILEAYEEHHVVKLLLKELRAEPKKTEEWRAKLIVLKENIEHHVKEEETMVFKRAEKILKKDQETELCRKMIEKKGKLLQK